MHDCSFKETGSEWRNVEGRSGKRSSRFTEKGDPLWIAAKLGNILLDPLEGKNLVVETLVTGCIFGSSVKESEGVESVVDGDDDYVSC